MDIMIGGEALSWWLFHYGGLALFCFLVLGILALPIPEETLLVVCGTMLQAGYLHPLGIIVAAVAGSICGISLSYLIGRSASGFILRKSAKWAGMGKKHLEKAHKWFEKYGTWTLFFGYFIPGVRHFTGISAGLTKLTYRRFALFAYGGAVIWVGLFLSIGYFFGGYFFSILQEIEIDTDDILTIAIAAIIVILVIYLKKRKK